MPRLVRLAFVLLIATVPLAACGKRGQLEPPPSSVQNAEDGEAGRTKAGGRKRVPIVAPKRDLLIDSILE
jgi:predicted small lipoprotein YifL